MSSSSESDIEIMAIDNLASPPKPSREYPRSGKPSSPLVSRHKPLELLRQLKELAKASPVVKEGKAKPLPPKEPKAKRLSKEKKDCTQRKSTKPLKVSSHVPRPEPSSSAPSSSTPCHSPSLSATISMFSPLPSKGDELLSTPPPSRASPHSAISLISPLAPTPVPSPTIHITIPASLPSLCTSQIVVTPAAPSLPANQIVSKVNPSPVTSPPASTNPITRKKCDQAVQTPLWMLHAALDQLDPLGNSPVRNSRIRPSEDARWIQRRAEVQVGRSRNRASEHQAHNHGRRSHPYSSRDDHRRRRN